MLQINPFKHLPGWSQRPITVGILLCGLVVVSLVYIFQDIGKFESDLPPASQWNAERVFNEFQQFMSVMEQHQRVEELLPQSVKYLRKLELMQTLRMELKKQFNVLMSELEKAVNFNRLYHAYIFREMPG